MMYRRNSLPCSYSCHCVSGDTQNDVNHCHRLRHIAFTISHVNTQIHRHFDYVTVRTSNRHILSLVAVYPDHMSYMSWSQYNLKLSLKSYSRPTCPHSSKCPNKTSRQQCQELVLTSTARSANTHTDWSC